MSASIRNRQVLSVSERKKLEYQIEQEKRRLGGEIIIPTKRGEQGMSERRMGKMSSFIDSHEDKQEIMRSLRRKQFALAQGMPEPLSRRDKTRLEDQARKDAEWLKSQMCPRTIYHKKESDPDFQKAVEAVKREDSPQFAKVAARYKQAMRRIDTETPDASSVEKLRPS